MRSVVGGVATTDKREKWRRLIVGLVFLFFFVLIFEGVLRKWAFPRYQKFLFFMRDPIVLLIYFLALKYKFWPEKERIYSYAMFLAKTAILLIAIQLLTTEASLISLIYGWRMWFFYIPLAFIIGKTFTIGDIKKVMKWSLLIAIPMALLVLKQARSPVHSFINRTPEEDIFYSVSGRKGGDITRVTGTFTFFHSWQIYLGSIITFCLIFWLLPKRDRPMKIATLIIATGAVITSFAVDVTRLPTILAAVTWAGCLFSSTLIKNKTIRLRTWSMSFAIIIAGIFTVTSIFLYVHEKRAARFDKDYLEKRITSMFVSGKSYFWRRPFFGVGIGSASRGGYVLGAGSTKSEHEWNNHISEAGMVFGLMYIAFRIALVLWLFRNAVRAARAADDPTPVILLAFSSPTILFWYLTTKGQVHAYGWLLAGLCIAANRAGLERINMQKNISHSA